MSGSCCMWCDMHPSQWNNDASVSSRENLWTIQRIKAVKDKIQQGKLKHAKDKLCVVDYPDWDFIDHSNYMLPQVHRDICLQKNVLEHFDDFLQYQVEKT